MRSQPILVFSNISFAQVYIQLFTDHHLIKLYLFPTLIFINYIRIIGQNFINVGCKLLVLVMPSGDEKTVCVCKLSTLNLVFSLLQACF